MVTDTKLYQGEARPRLAGPVTSGGCGAACCSDRELPTRLRFLLFGRASTLGGKPQRPSKYSVHCFGGGGQTVEAAGSCAGGGGGEGLEAALGAGSALAVLAVCVLWRPTWWTGFGAGWSTTWTGLGARVGGGFSQNEWSGCGPRVTWMVCGR